jgi:hypothetical protein
MDLYLQLTEYVCLALCSVKRQDIFTPMPSLDLGVDFLLYIDFWLSIG